LSGETGTQANPQVTPVGCFGIPNPRWEDERVTALHLVTDGAEESLSARLLDELRARIIRGDYPPGTRLRERELAEEFRVSRIPLREALPQLEAEGFIVTLPRRGAVVTQLSLRDVEELFEVRLDVEVLATRRAAQRVAAGASADAVRAAMAHSQAAVAEGDPLTIAEASSLLHEAIVALAGNSLLSTMMRTVAVRDRWVFKLASDREPDVACDEHHRLCDAIYAGNGDLAAAVAYTHIDRARQAAMSTLALVLPATREEIPER
jgi:DNA-binding GntR family transcriptional regulator